MKKLLLLFTAFTFIFTACSDDDSTDPFIGNWSFYQSFENGVEQSINSCDMQDRVIVNEDGTMSTTTYYTKSDGSCELDFSGTGTWVNNGDGSYSTTFEEQTSTVEITFVNDTFYIEIVEEDYTYKNVYRRS